MKVGRGVVGCIAAFLPRAMLVLDVGNGGRRAGSPDRSKGTGPEFSRGITLFDAMRATPSLLSQLDFSESVGKNGSLLDVQE